MVWSQICDFGGVPGSRKNATLAVKRLNSAHICLVEHRSFSTLEGGMLAASFLHTSFLQVINAVMLWSVHVQKVPQASEHLCPAKLQTRCDICCACQSICPFIVSEPGNQCGNKDSRGNENRKSWTNVFFHG